MGAVGMLLLTAGYGLLYYGVCQVKGATAGLASYFIPGAMNSEKGFAYCPPSGSQSPTAKQEAGKKEPKFGTTSSTGTGSGSTGVTLV